MWRVRRNLPCSERGGSKRFPPLMMLQALYSDSLNLRVVGIFKVQAGAGPRGFVLWFGIWTSALSTRSSSLWRGLGMVVI